MKTQYKIDVETGTGFARLTIDGVLWTRLWLGSKVDTTAGVDEAAGRSTPRVSTTEYGCRIDVDMLSSVWRSERFVLECHEDYAAARVEVEGNGNITNLWLMGSYMNEPKIVGRIYSQAYFGCVYSPAPSGSGRNVRGAGESTALSVAGSYLPGHSDWYFTPPPSCFAMSMAPAPVEFLNEPAGPWMGVCLQAAPGEHNYSDFDYLADERAFTLGLRYGGQLHVDGKFISPEVIMTFGHPDTAAALRDYRKRYVMNGPRSAEPERPAWWSEPIFCGWGAQEVLSLEAKVSVQDVATRLSYDGFLTSLTQAGIVPGTVVIDDKWQREYGTNSADPVKWPQLRRWIRAKRTAGQKVLLWLKLWDPEGLPAEECIVNHLGMPVAADPTNPRYELRLRRAVRRMLSDEGYGASGFKLDFSGRIPVASNLKRHGTQWGLELQHKLLEIIYSEAKLTRPDALIIGHVPHPYFTDVIDMIRLNDVTQELPVVRQMRQRAEVVRAVCPELLIDSDNWRMPNIEQWREYMAVAADIGVPALYYCTGLPDEPFEAADYERIRRAFARRGEQTA